MATLVKIAEMTVNGQPYLCPDCDTPAFNLESRGPFTGTPAWGNCTSFHSWEDPIIDAGTLKLILAARTGRRRAEDIDTFEIIEHGNQLAGILQPDVIADDLKRAVKDVYWQRIIRPGLRRRKKAAGRALRRPLKAAAAVVDDGVAAAKAAAIGAAWGLQAGGTDPDPDYQPEPINPCAACKGRGHHKLDSRIHGTTTLPCSVCYGTGEID